MIRQTNPAEFQELGCVYLVQCGGPLNIVKKNKIPQRIQAAHFPGFLEEIRSSSESREASNKLLKQCILCKYIILGYCACYYVYKTCIQLYLKVLSYKPVCLYTSLSLVQFCFHFTALCFCWAKFYYQPENTNCSTG